MIDITALDIGILFLWLCSATADYSEFVYVWQLKEYRWDKFRDFMGSASGHAFRATYPIFARSVIAAIAFLISYPTEISIQALLIIFFAGDLVIQSGRWYQGKLHRPAVTSKALLILASSILLEFILFLLIREWSILLFLLIARFYLVSVVVTVFWYPTAFAKRLIITLAKRKMRRFPQLTVIGVTGSYGKSSVKRFLRVILEEDFSVIRTPGNINTDIGVALHILRTPLEGVDMFVVEMGAYKIGEIKAICDIVQPSIGILTTIGEEHLALFGSMKNIQKAKYELLRALPENGLAITLGDNEMTTEFLNELQAPCQLFGVDERPDIDLHIEDIDDGTEGLTMTYSVEGTMRTVNTPLHGGHNALNIAPCILVARHLGMSFDRIHARIEQLPQPRRALELYQYGTAILIDDSYNANPTGFMAALDYLHTFPSKLRRVVVTRGMLELGEQSSELHEKVAGSIAYIADDLVLISRDEEQAMKRGLVSDKYKTTFQLILDHGELLRFFQEQRDKEVVILIENKLPVRVYDNILANAEKL